MTFHSKIIISIFGLLNTFLLNIKVPLVLLYACICISLHVISIYISFYRLCLLCSTVFVYELHSFALCDSISGLYLKLLIQDVSFTNNFLPRWQDRFKYFSVQIGLA